MGLEWKIDVLPALKDKGYTTYKLRKEVLISESAIQRLRENKPISWENLERICEMLNCQPGDILKYVKGDK